MSGARPFSVQATGRNPSGKPWVDGRSGFYCRFGKRLFDVIAAAFGLAAVTPVLLIAALIVRIDSPGPVLFRQERLGQGGRRFTMLKFRTMVHHAEGQCLHITAAGDARITRAGRWLRQTKLDELPQLFNVLRGDMSLVGPRPEVPEYVAGYDSVQLCILDLKPGITSLASMTFHDEEGLLAGRTDKEAFYVSTLLPRKLAYDLSYRENIGFSSDLRIIFATLVHLLRSRTHVSRPTPLLPRRG